MENFRVKVVHKFLGLHYLKSYKGKPEPLHKHNYKVEVVIEGKLNGEEYVVDFLEVKSYLEKLLPDNININELFDGNSTSEKLAQWIFHRLKERFSGVKEVVVWETENFAAIYSSS